MASADGWPPKASTIEVSDSLEAYGQWTPRRYVWVLWLRLRDFIHQPEA